MGDLLAEGASSRRSTGRFVHGDYRTGNFLESGGRITAILDWELVHLGDPLEDLGWVCMRSFRGRSPYMCHLIERPRLYERYEELSGSRCLPPRCTSTRRSAPSSSP